MIERSAIFSHPQSSETSGTAITSTLSLDNVDLSVKLKSPFPETNVPCILPPFTGTSCGITNRRHPHRRRPQVCHVVSSSMWSALCYSAASCHSGESSVRPEQSSEKRSSWGKTIASNMQDRRTTKTVRSGKRNLGIAFGKAPVASQRLRRVGGWRVSCVVSDCVQQHRTQRGRHIRRSRGMILESFIFIGISRIPF